MTEQQEKRLDELLDLESGLSAWEMDFIEAMDDKREHDLTDGQANKLSEIWERRCR